MSVKLRAEADCPSHSLANISVRDVTCFIDEPIARGGTNMGPTPTDTALAALIGCTNVIGHKCADSLGIDIGHLKIGAACELDRRGVTLQEEIDVPFVKIQLNIEADGSASEEELLAVAKETAKFCPLSKLFKGSGTIVEENWTKSTL